MAVCILAPVADEPTHSPSEAPMEPYGPDLGEFDNLKSPGRFMAWATAILIVGFALGLAARPVFHALKSRRARSLAAEGEVQLAAGHLTEAMAKVRAALALGPGELEVLRLAARGLTALRSPESLTYWETLCSNPDATKSDRLDMVRTALVFARFETARQALERLYDKDANDQEVLGLGIAYFRATGNLAKALDAARQLLEVAEISEATRLAAAEVLVNSPSDADVVRGRGILTTLGNAKGGIANSARTVLAAIPNLPDDEAQHLFLQLTNSPVPDLQGQLRTVELWQRLHPQQTNEMCEWYQARLGKEPPATDDIVLIAGWWLEQNRADYILRWIPEDRSATNADWLITRMQAYASLKRWDVVGQMLENTNNVLNPFQRDVFRTLNLWSQGDTQNAQRLLFVLASEAQNHPERLLLLAAAAENVGATSMAVECWRDLSRLPALQLPAAIRAMKAARRLGDARTIVDVYREFLKVVPSDYGVRADIVYYRLLLGDPTSEVGRQLRLLPAAVLDSDRGQMLLAMLALRESNFDEALSRIEAPHYEWTKVEPRWKLLYATVLSANRQKEAARAVISQLNPADYLPIEKQFANAWLPIHL